MMYYNKQTNTVAEAPHFVTPENCRDYGYYPVYNAPFDEDLRFYTRNEGPLEFDENADAYIQNWVTVPLPLETIKAPVRELFVSALAESDRRGARSAQDLEARRIEIETAQKLLSETASAEAISDLKLVISELEAAQIIDEEILLGTRKTAEWNRLELENVMASDDWETVKNATPWKPWEKPVASIPQPPILPE